MKIYKLSQDFKMIQQNTQSQNDPNVQLQNLQQAQSAIDYLENIINISQKLMADLRELENAMGIGDVGMRNQILNTFKEAVMTTPAFNLLAQMNMVSSIDNLISGSELSRVKNLITTNIASINDQVAALSNFKQVGQAGQAGQAGTQQ